MTSSLQISVRMSRFWTIMAIVWLVRGIDHIGSFYSWLKHGLPVDTITYAMSIRFVCFVLAILILVRQYQYKKEQPITERPL